MSNIPQKERITDSELLETIINCPTIREAARQLNLSETTVYKRLSKSSIRTQLAEHRKRQFQIASSKLTHITGNCIDTLYSIITDPQTPAGVKVRACDNVLTLTLKLNEQLDILDRIHQIENELKALK